MLDNPTPVAPNTSVSRTWLRSVQIDYSVIRANAARVAREVGVPVIAVVKADAYGLGASAVAEAVADLVRGFCVFSLDEAIAARLWEIGGKPTLAIGPAEVNRVAEYRAAHVAPAVHSAEQAAALRECRPVLSVDTGMQRFACPPEQVDAAIEAGGITEAFTHAVRPAQAHQLKAMLGQRGMFLHAAATGLMDDPTCRLDAVRVGLGLYRGAMRVSAPLVEARDTRGPAGYSGFNAPRIGVIVGGYSNGLRVGPCIVNGQRRRILEVGMQSAYIEISKNDRRGDAVTLLGEGLTEAEVAAAWGSSPQTVLVQLAGMR